MEADREGWSDNSTDVALERSYEQEAKEIQDFVNAVREIEAWEERQYRRRRAQGQVEYDSDADEIAALNEESDSENEGRPPLTTPGNECRGSVYLYDDRSDSDSDSERLSRRFADHCDFSVRDHRGRSVGFDCGFDSD